MTLGSLPSVSTGPDERTFNIFSRMGSGRRLTCSSPIIWLPARLFYPPLWPRVRLYNFPCLRCLGVVCRFSGRVPSSRFLVGVPPVWPCCSLVSFPADLTCIYVSCVISVHLCVYVFVFVFWGNYTCTSIGLSMSLCICVIIRIFISHVYCRLLCGRVSYTIVNCILGSSLPHVFCVTPKFLCICSIILLPVRVCSCPVPVSLYTFNTSFFPSRRLLNLTFLFLSTCHWIGRACDRTFPPFCLASDALRRSSPLSSSLGWFPSFVVWRWSSAFGGSRIHNRGILRPNLRTPFFSSLRLRKTRVFCTTRPFFLPRPFFSRFHSRGILRPNLRTLFFSSLCLRKSAFFARPVLFSPDPSFFLPDPSFWVRNRFFPEPSVLFLRPVGCSRPPVLSHSDKTTGSSCPVPFAEDTPRVCSDPPFFPAADPWVFLLRTHPRFLPCPVLLHYGTYCAFFSAVLLLRRRPRVFTTRPFLFIFPSCLFS